MMSLLPNMSLTLTCNELIFVIFGKILKKKKIDKALSFL